MLLLSFLEWSPRAKTLPAARSPKAHACSGRDFFFITGVSPIVVLYIINGKWIGLRRRGQLLDIVKACLQEPWWRSK